MTTSHPSISVRAAHVAAIVSVLAVMTASAVLGQDNGLKRPPPTGTILLDVGKSQIVTAPWQVKRVSVTEPKIADVEILTPTQFLVMAKSPGSTDVIMWSQAEQVQQINIVVNLELGQIKSQLRKLFPSARLEVSQVRDVLVVRGSLARTAHVQQMHKFFEASGLRYVDMTQVAGLQQVHIQVRVAEVSRKAFRTLGINWLFTSKEFSGAGLTGSATTPLQTMDIGPTSGAFGGNIPIAIHTNMGLDTSINLFGILPRIPVALFVQALAENQYLRILAEPNLVALSGEEASFLAGGEIPIPVVQGGTTGSTSITIEYREVGVRLRFRPVVTGDNTIELRVAPEVSEISEVNSVTIQNSTIPTLITRKAETTVRLKSGQTFGMAGLIRHTNTARASRVPGLGDLPIVGALFRSVRYTKNETELVVLVTASLVEPLSVTDRPAVGDEHVPPNDWELYAEGRIEGKATHSAAFARQLRHKGFDRLKGPGAWAAHDRPAAHSRAKPRSEGASQRPASRRPRKRKAKADTPEPNAKGSKESKG